MMDWGELPQAERNALYNNSAAVKGSAEMVAAWEAASTIWRERHPGHLGLAYGQEDRQRWDLFPASNPKKPCLIHIHGGYWQMRSKDTFSCLAEGVAAHGWSFALPGYTLAPGKSLSGIVDELRGALDWFAGHRREHGFEGPLILSGWSAGGHLAAMLMDHPSVSAALAISGIYELGPLRDTYINEKLKLTDQEMASLSPMRLAPTGKPMVIAYGTAELSPLVENSRRFHRKRAEAHAPGTLIPVPAADHFTILDELRRPGGVLTKATIRLWEDLG